MVEYKYPFVGDPVNETATASVIKGAAASVVASCAVTVEAVVFESLPTDDVRTLESAEIFAVSLGYHGTPYRKIPAVVAV